MLPTQPNPTLLIHIPCHPLPLPRLALALALSLVPDPDPGPDPNAEAAAHHAATVAALVVSPLFFAVACECRYRCCGCRCRCRKRYCKWLSLRCKAFSPPFPFEPKLRIFLPSLASPAPFPFLLSHCPSRLDLSNVTLSTIRYSKYRTCHL